MSDALDTLYTHCGCTKNPPLAATNLPVSVVVHGVDVEAVLGRVRGLQGRPASDRGVQVERLLVAAGDAGERLARLAAGAVASAAHRGALKEKMNFLRQVKLSFFLDYFGATQLSAGIIGLLGCHDGK